MPRCRADEVWAGSATPYGFSQTRQAVSRSVGSSVDRQVQPGDHPPLVLGALARKGGVVGGAKILVWQVVSCHELLHPGMELRLPESLVQCLDDLRIHALRPGDAVRRSHHHAVAKLKQ